MMSPRVKALLWRGGSVTVLCGVPVLLAVLCVANIIQVFDSNDLAGRQTATLSQIVAKLAKHQSHGMSAQDIASLYLGSATSSLARAEIQARMTKLVEGAGGRIAEVQLTATPEQEADGTVAIQVSLEIDNKGLFDLLYGLESGLPLLTITDLDTRSGNGPADEATADKGLLHVEMTVQSHFRKSAG